MHKYILHSYHITRFTEGNGNSVYLLGFVIFTYNMDVKQYIIIVANLISLCLK